MHAVVALTILAALLSVAPLEASADSQRATLPPEPRVALLGDSYQSGEGLVAENTSYICGTDLHEGNYPTGTNLRGITTPRNEWAFLEIEDRLGRACNTNTNAPINFDDVVRRVNDGQLTVEDGKSNLCHRSTTAYPWMVASRWLYASEILFASCSGAKVGDIVDQGQYDGNAGRGLTLDGVIGGRSQLDELKDFAADGPVDVVLLGIGGNDLGNPGGGGLGDVVTDCMLADCTEKESVYLDRVAELRPDLQRAINEIARVVGLEAEIVLFGYPTMVHPKEGCAGMGAAPFRIKKSERKMLAQRLLPALNLELEAAAEEAGIRFVDLTPVFGKEDAICGSQAKFNGIRGGDDVYGLVGNESFHPSELGHKQTYCYLRLHGIGGLPPVNDCDGNPTTQQLCNGKTVTVYLQAGERPTKGDDVILGTSNADVINGLAGDDTICAEGGNDNVKGGKGEDWISLGGGNDTASGGPNDDEIYGGRGNDRISGNGGDDKLRGEGNSDRLLGGNGKDDLDGGQGKDRLFGQKHNDVLRGGTQVDTVDGGNGKDACIDPGGRDKKKNCEFAAEQGLLRSTGIGSIDFGIDANKAFVELIELFNPPTRDSGWIDLEPHDDGSGRYSPRGSDPYGQHISDYPELRYLCFDTSDVGTCTIFHGDDNGSRWFSAWEQGLTSGFDPSPAASSLPRTPEGFAVGTSAPKLANTSGIVLRGGEGSMLLFRGLGYEGRLEGSQGFGGVPPNIGQHVMCITAGERPLPGFGDVCGAGIRMPS